MSNKGGVDSMRIIQSSDSTDFQNHQALKASAVIQPLCKFNCPAWQTPPLQYLASLKHTFKSMCKYCLTWIWFSQTARSFILLLQHPPSLWTARLSQRGAVLNQDQHEIATERIYFLAKLNVRHFKIFQVSHILFTTCVQVIILCAEENNQDVRL